MKRQTSLSSLTKTKGVVEQRNKEPQLFGAKRISPSPNLQRTSPSPNLRHQYPLVKQPLVTSKKKTKQMDPSPTSIKRTGSAKSLVSNKQNNNRVNNPQDKPRTIKNVRLQNTKKEPSISRQPSKILKQSLSSKKGMPFKPKEIKITVSSPKKQQAKKDESLLLEGEEDPILKYVSPFKQSKRHSILDFKILKTITEDSYFRDVLVFHSPTKCLFTIRIINKQQVVEEEKVSQLTEALKIHFYLNKLHLPHLQTLYGVIEDPCDIYLILQPLVPSLEEPRINGRQSQLCLSILSKNILVTLNEVHREKVMLRKLQSKCIKKHLGVNKICLLDSAASYRIRRRRNSFLGSIQQIPHQLAQGSSYNESCDLWSLGLLLYQAATGVFPFYGPQLLQHIQQLDYDMPMCASQDLCNFLNRLLTEELNRMTIEEALSHAFTRRSELQRNLIPRDLWAFWDSS